MAWDVRDKLCLITGGSGGIGRTTARTLAAMGARVIITARGKERGEAAARETGAELLLVDLSVQKDIRRAAGEFLSRFPRLDVLINNAGALFPRRERTADGIEATFALNHLAYFLLTDLLVSRLRESAPARIINVASEAQVAGRIAFNDLQGERFYSAWRAYSQSKRANVLFTQELARRLAGTGVTANCLHPGTVATGFGRGGTGVIAWLLRAYRPWMRTPEQGADTVVYLAASSEVEGVTGKYFVDRKVKTAVERYDASDARRLWEVSEEMVRE